MWLQVFGISGDDPDTNKEFKRAQNLPYDLLSDQSNILRKTFGIKNALFVLPGRQTYVIDKNGMCTMSFKCASFLTMFVQIKLVTVPALEYSKGEGFDCSPLHLLAYVPEMLVHRHSCSTPMFLTAFVVSIPNLRFFGCIGRCCCQLLRWLPAVQRHDKHAAAH